MWPFTKRKPKHILDASRMMEGEMLLGEQVNIREPWWRTQNNAIGTAVKAGWVSQEQANASLFRYYPQPTGQLLCARIMADDSGLMVGTSVPAGMWSRK